MDIVPPAGFLFSGLPVTIPEDELPSVQLAVSDSRNSVVTPPAAFAANVFAPAVVHSSDTLKIPPTPHSTAQPIVPPDFSALIRSTQIPRLPTNPNSNVKYGRSRAVAFGLKLDSASHEPCLINLQLVALRVLTKSLAAGPTVPSPVPSHSTVVPAIKSAKTNEPEDLIVTGVVIGLPFNNHCKADADADTTAETANTATSTSPTSLNLANINNSLTRGSTNPDTTSPPPNHRQARGTQDTPAPHIRARCVLPVQHTQPPTSSKTPPCF
jgi:hypothetical protein